MPFIRHRPQWAIHTDGYQVMSNGRFGMKYKDEFITAEIEVDSASKTIYVFSKTLKIMPINEHTQIMSSEEIIGRICEGIQFLEPNTRIISGHLRKLAVYLRKDKLFIYPCSETVSGGYVDDYEAGIHILDTEDISGINQAVLQALGACQEELPDKEWKEVPVTASVEMRPLLDAAGVKSYREFPEGTKYLSIDTDYSKIDFFGNKNIPGKGFIYFPEGHKTYPFSPHMNFAGIIIEILELCE